MLNFDSNKVKVHFSENTILQMEFTLVKFKFYMETFFNTYFHFNRPIYFRFSSTVVYNKFFFFSYTVVISINHHIYIVTQTNNYTVIAFKLFFNTVELEII